jgi:hypothetical protein
MIKNITRFDLFEAIRDFTSSPFQTLVIEISPAPRFVLTSLKFLSIQGEARALGGARIHLLQTGVALLP